jgi:predicted phage terminase large subunit-like protein
MTEEYKKQFIPNPKQLQLTNIAWQDPYVENLLAFGPSRSGKSAILTALTVARALAFPGTKHAIFRLTLRSCHSHLFHGTFPEIMDMLYPGYLDRADVRVAKADNVVELHNGSKIFFEGLDPTRIDKVLGAQYATAWINECNEIDDYEIVQQLASRMADTAPMIGGDGKPVIGPDGNILMCRPLMLFDCNPDVKSDWEYQTFRLKQHPTSGKPFKDESKRKWRAVFLPAHENAGNIAAGYLDALAERYDGSPNMASRFLEGRWRDDNPNAMFRKSMFQFKEVARDFLVRIIVAVDPAGSSGNNSDYTGIVVVGIGFDGNAYVLEDASLQGTPEQWAKRVITMYDNWEADMIVAEKNYGGEMVEHTIRTARKNVPVKMVNASRGKLLRAEPVQMLYLQKKVFHTDSFKELEAQMCDYKPETKKSPDRMDALVWGLTELMKLNGQGAGGVTVTRSGGVWRR